MPPKVVVICGPTASGKTALSIALAKQFDGEIISADSMQVYKGMDIGTAKPTQQEQQGIVHHMLSVVSPEEDFSVARYAQMAKEATDAVLSRGKLPIIAGGTGLYIDALLRGQTFSPAPAPALRQSLEAEYDEKGGIFLHEKLSAYDKESAARLHPNDKKRIVRALEIYLSTGKTISEHDAQSKTLPPQYHALTLALNYKNRDALRSRICQRVDEMVSMGLIDEVSALLSSGISPNATAMQAIGYKELSLALSHPENKEKDDRIDDALAQIKLRSCQYAKRQLTWFRRNPTANWILWDDRPDFTRGLRTSTEFVADFRV